MSDYEYKEVQEAEDEADAAEAAAYSDADYNYAESYADEPDDGNELNHAGVVHEPEQDPDAVREQDADLVQAAQAAQDLNEEYTTEDDPDGVPVINSDHSVKFVKPGPVNAVNE